MIINDLKKENLEISRAFIACIYYWGRNRFKIVFQERGSMACEVS